MDTFPTIGAFAHRRWIRTLVVSVAVAASGILAPAAALADEAAFDPLTQNERSIMLIESKEATATAGTDWTSLQPGQSADERSIALIEGSDPANFPVAIGGDAEFQPPTANERSIALIESKEAPVPGFPVARSRSRAV